MFVFVRMGHDGIGNTLHICGADRDTSKCILPRGCLSVLGGMEHEPATEAHSGVLGARGPSVLSLHFLEHKASLFVVAEENYLSSYSTLLCFNQYVCLLPVYQN